MFVLFDNNGKIMITNNVFIERPWLTTIERDDFTAEENKFIWLWATINTDGTLNITSEMKAHEINEAFNKKIADYHSSYPIEEQKRFADKVRKADKVIAWGTDYYIDIVAQAKWVTSLDVANLIKSKADAFEAFYTQAEIERDNAISLLT